MPEDPYCPVATIGGTYGVNGWVKLTVRTETLELFLSFEALFLKSTPSPIPKANKAVVTNTAHATKVAKAAKATKDRGSQSADRSFNLPEKWYPFTFEEIKLHGKGLIAKLPGCSTKEQAAQFTGREIGVPQSHLPQLDDGEHYWSDLIGLVVTTAAGERLGTVAGLLETGANDVLVVQPDEASLDDKERLIPYLPEQVILEVDQAANKMVVDWDSDF